MDYSAFCILKDCFKENGIVIDSSVMHGICQDNKYSKFDFRYAPNKEIYRFLDDVCVEDEMVSLLKYRLRFIIETY